MLIAVAVDLTRYIRSNDVSTLHWRNVYTSPRLLSDLTIGSITLAMVMLVG